MKTKGKKLRILITAGGTREYIDPVRFISNASSGKMGYAMAKAALAAGHAVTLVSAPTALTPPKGTKVINVESAAQMYAAVKEHFGACDCLIMAAAVSDYTPVKVSKTKIKKSSGQMVLKLKPTVDILAWAGGHKERQFLVGFALEDVDLKARAKKKLTAKRLDMIAANAPTAIGSEKSQLFILDADGTWTEIRELSKDVSAKRLIAIISKKTVAKSTSAAKKS